MANKLKKLMKPILKQKCSEAYQAGYRKGLEDGWKKKLMAYESEIECLKLILKQCQSQSVRPVMEGEDGN